MVAGRRRVAAASVATAYALHVYVLQHHFRPPQTDRPSLPFPTHPHYRKLVCNARGYFSWVCWRFSLFHPSLPILSRSTTTLSTPREATHARSCFLLRATRREATPNRTAHPPFHSVLSLSIRPLLTFSFFYSGFLPLLLMVFARLGPSLRPTPELK